MGKSLENNRKTIRKPKENIGKPSENNEKTIGKPSENHRKARRASSLLLLIAVHFCFGLWYFDFYECGTFVLFECGTFVVWLGYFWDQARGRAHGAPTTLALGGSFLVLGWLWTALGEQGRRAHSAGKNTGKSIRKPSEKRQKNSRKTFRKTEENRGNS